MRHVITSVILAMSLTAIGGCATSVDEPLDEAAQRVVECDENAPVVTRTQGFWQYHSCVVKGDATGVPLVPLALGSAKKLDKPQAVYDYLNTSTGGDKQTILGHQLVASKLNAAAFGIGGVKFADWDADGNLESVNQLLDIADALYDSASDADRGKMATILDKLNNTGNEEELYFDPTCNSAPVAPPPDCE